MYKDREPESWFMPGFIEDLPAGVFEMHQMKWICDAYEGSLDAAKALHDAVLPGYTRAVDATMPEAGIAVYLHKDGEERFSGDLPSEARAWLLAIIRALIAQEDHT